MKIVSMFLALALTAIAADTPPRMSRITLTEIPPDSAADFYAVQRETADVYKAGKAPMPRLAWSSLTGERVFVSLVPLSGLDKLNEPTWLSKQGEEMPRQARQARLRKASGPSTVKIITTQEDATWDPTPDAVPAAFISVTVYSVKPGKVTDFLALMKEATATTKKIGKAKNVYVERTNYGGDGYEFHVVTGYASLADIPTGGAARAAMGETAYTAFIQKMGATVATTRRDIFRFRPEFSYLPAK